MLEEYGDMDIALDPLPFSGGATTCDALWMGVPVITLRGRRFASNHTVSHLQAAGLPELVADDEAAYVAACRRLAADLPALERLRAGLRQQLALSPLCSPRLFMAPVERHFLALLDGR
jgi:predicted O-linked N-acetylglucosamine transferase (SPINDLY family)